jgi:hypothetical protein
LIGRFFVGIGHAVVSTTVYTVEVTTKEFRGTFSVLESVLRLEKGIHALTEDLHPLGTKFTPGANFCNEGQISPKGALA